MVFDRHGRFPPSSIFFSSALLTNQLLDCRKNLFHIFVVFVFSIKPQNNKKEAFQP